MRSFPFGRATETRGDGASTSKWCISALARTSGFGRCSGTMLGIDVGAPPLPNPETRIEFIRRYAEDSGKRLAVLRAENNSWWEENATFFDVQRARNWIMTRRIAHTAHHRGQQSAMLRMLGRELHSNYGPTADTGGLMASHAPTIYAYPSLESLIQGESAGGAKSRLPGAGGKPVTERPGAK